MALKVDVKWQKELFAGIEIDTSQPPVVFKTQLYTLTGVPPERQKIMVKGGMLGDDADWAKTGIKPGQKLMMMGTADAIPQAPKEGPKFVEDLPEDQQDLGGLARYGAGLTNLGNTCYMNSTVQCLYSVPELRHALQGYGQAGGSDLDSAHKLTLAARDLWGDLERSAAPVPPFRFLLMLRERYPQFAQQGPGGYMQQDAEECWTQIMQTLRERVKDPSADAGPLIQELFGVGLHTSLKCEESGETIEEDSTALSLKCNISIEVNHLSDGLRLALKDDREKNSDALGRSALFAGASQISRLPHYLTVQMMRFFYKVDTQQKAKILRKVTFPMVLDLYEFCTPAFRGQLDGPRAAAKAADDVAAGIAKAAKDKAKEAKEAAGGSAIKGKEAGTQEAKKAKSAPAPAADKAASASAADVEMADAQAGPSGSSAAGDADLQAKYAGQLTGKYELVAVLTHKGRSADSGHYVSWVRQPDAAWVQFDDDELIPRKEEEVLALAGGGDWHMAYMLLYRAQRVPAPAAAAPAPAT